MTAPHETSGPAAQDGSSQDTADPTAGAPASDAGELDAEGREDGQRPGISGPGESGPAEAGSVREAGAPPNGATEREPAGPRPSTAGAELPAERDESTEPPTPLPPLSETAEARAGEREKDSAVTRELRFTPPPMPPVPPDERTTDDATLLLAPLADGARPPLPPQQAPHRPGGQTSPEARTTPPASGSHGPAPRPTRPPSQATPRPATPEAQPTYRPPPSVPVSVPVTGPEVAEAKRRARHGDSIPRRTVQALHRLVSSTARETSVATETARAIQQPVAGGRQLAVTSIRGGAGKSTVAALLSLTYAHYRNDPTLAVEADPALGTLPGRLGAAEIRWTCTDLARIITPSMRLTDVTGYLVRLPGGGWLLPASQGAVGAQLDLETYRVVMTSLARYFGTTVVDCETLPAEVARTSLTTTQARVLVTPATVEGVAATRSVLDWMSGLHPRTLATTVVAMSHAVPDTALDEAKATRHLGVGGVTVVSVPYDRHLAAGGAIRTELLGHQTRVAAARLAAECMTRAVSFDHPSGPAPRR